MPDYRSPEALAYRQWYKTQAWQRIRSYQLAQQPLCAFCEAQGRTTAASICDHVTPHRGDRHLFFSGPFQSLCKPCHDRVKQADEHRGFSADIGSDGWPVDANHPSNRT